VGGAELAHLSGAWQASIGIEDSRFVPTLFQGVAALTFNLSESERPVRAIALAATLTIPIALFRLRRSLGEGGSLLTLLLLGLDPIGIVLGVTATAAAWDTTIAVWLVVALIASRPPPWLWVLLTFLAVTAGPIILPVVLAAVGIAAIREPRPDCRTLVWGALGALLGVFLTSFQFGVGIDGLQIAPFLLFVEGFEKYWSAFSAAELAALYGLPLLIGGVIAGVWLLVTFRVEKRTPTAMESLCLGMTGVSLTWFLVALPSNSPFPLGAATLFSCFLLGPALSRALGFLMSVNWNSQRFQLPLVFGLAAIGLFVLSNWAHEGRSGSADEWILLSIPIFLALVGVLSLVFALVSRNREGPLLALVSFVVAGGGLLITGASGVLLSGSGEPLPGPISPSSARVIRDVAFTATDSRASVVVHEQYRDELTWTFRNSPTLTLASRVPLDANVVVWPLDAPPPEGFVALEGRWVIGQAFRAPDGFLDLVRWFTERNTLRQDQELVAIYVRGP
tara:strand:- start:432 stop:1952 length:1521 start_codon:yes stop_codon:yes gene_type:complete